MPEARTSFGTRDRLSRVVAELARRKLEGLRLYAPMPEQERFHASRARVRLLRGGNRAGKTLPAAAEVARAVTGCGLGFPKENGRIFAVGKNLRHVGDVMWRKLGESGPFKVIRDEHTKEWRAFRPWAPYDRAHAEKAREAAPLIPPRLVRSISWESKGKNIPEKVILETGWELSFFSGEGKPPQGSDIDAAWLDEEIPNELWYPEMRARLLDRQGRLWWSATPEAGTDQLYEIHEQAESLFGTPDPEVEEFVILLAENRHIAETEKQALARDLSDEQRKVKVEGQFAIVSYRVYPSFSMKEHGYDLEGNVPGHWTRYAVVDPGHQVCAVLFAAVPPPTEGEFVLLYDELYLKECDAPMFGEAMRQKCMGQRFQAFIMDQHFGLHTESGTGKSVLQQYSDVLFQNGVKSASTGHSFRLASDDVTAGVTAVRTWLAHREGKGPRLRVARGRLPWFLLEIGRYHNKREGGVLVDRPNQKKLNHTMDCLRYLAMLDPRYVSPSKPEGQRPSGAYAYWLAREKRRGASNGPSIRLGPGRKYG